MPEPKPPKKSKLLLILALAAAAAAALVALVWVLRGRAIHRQLAARIEALRKAGEPVTMEELAATYPGPPAGRNAADLFNQAFTEMNARYDANAEQELPITGAPSLPKLGEPPPPEMLGRIRAYLSKHERTLRLLREAAAVDECRFDLNFSLGCNMPLNHIAKMAAAARLLALQAIERTERGKGDEAAESLWAILRAAHAIRHEPLLVSAFWRLNCARIGIEQTERCASRIRPSPQALRRLADALRDEFDPQMAERALVADRCLFLDGFNGGYPSGLSGSMSLATWLGLESGFLAEALARIPVRYRYTDSEKLLVLDYVHPFLAAAREPYPDSLIKGVRLPPRPVPPRYAIAAAHLPDCARASFHVQRHMAMLESARMAMAVLLYLGERGDLPGKLEHVVPAFADSVPPDPYDGKPLRYRRTPEGFVVYSVGGNGTDDGGEVQFVPSRGELDVGFRVRWPKARF